MTGTARAALRLALGLLRRSVDDPPECCDIATIGEVADVIAMMEQSWDGPLSSALHGAQRYGRDWRILRARLALYLRAVLRAEAGDAWDMERAESDEAGEWHAFERLPAEWIIVCEGCRARLGPRCGFVAGDTTTEPCPITGKPERVRLAVPLWSQAPTRAR